MEAKKNAEHVPHHHREADKQPQHVKFRIVLRLRDAGHDPRRDAHRQKALEHVEREDEEEKPFAQQASDVGRADVPAAGHADIDSAPEADEKPERD